MEQKNYESSFSTDEAALDNRPVLVHVAPSPEFALNFLCKHLQYFQGQGFRVVLVAGGSHFLPEIEQTFGIETAYIPLNEDPGSADKLRSAWELMYLFRRYRATVVHAFTPKTGLISMLGASFAGVPVRLYSKQSPDTESVTGLKKIEQRLTCSIAHRVLSMDKSDHQALQEPETGYAPGIADPDKVTEYAKKTCHSKPDHAELRQHYIQLLREKGRKLPSGKKAFTKPEVRRKDLEQSDNRPVLIHVAPIPEFAWTFLCGQLKYYKEQGFRVIVVTGGEQLSQEMETTFGIETAHLRLSRTVNIFSDLLSTWQLMRLIRAYRATIVHGHTSKIGAVSMLAAFIAWTPLRIYTNHGLARVGTTGIAGYMLEAVERITCMLAHQVLTVSKSNQKTFNELKLCAPEKVKTLANGSITGLNTQHFDPEKWRFAVPLLRDKLGIPQKAKVMGYVGRIVRYKGIAELAQSFKQLASEYPDLHLLIVGAEDNKDPVDPEVIKFLKNHERVHFTGYIQMDVKAPPSLYGFLNEMPPYYLTMDILTLPSYWEGFGYSLLEASAMELPCVATAISGIQDAVVGGETGIMVSPYDVTGLTDAFCRLLADDQLSRRLGQAGRRRVMEQFSKEPIWQAQVELYHKWMKELGLYYPKVNTPQSGIKRWIKRSLDVAASGTLLLLISPLLAGIALLIRLSMGSPVLFRQMRPGFKERIYANYKFRTMKNTTDEKGNLLPDAERMTGLGNFLRKLSLDELPQLWNVLKGELSLVGPRPLLPRYLDRYRPDQHRRHAVLPGITGWAQVNGRNTLSWEQKFEHDLYYVDNWSLGMDLEIIWKTIGKVLRSEDISQEGEATMAEFMGSPRTGAPLAPDEVTEGLKLIHTTTIPETAWVFLNGQLQFIKDKGFEVHLASSSGPLLADTGRREGVRTWEIALTRRITLLSDLWALAQFTMLFRRLKPHVLHAHTPKAGLISMLAGWITGVPVRIYTIHGFPHMEAKPLMRFLLRLCEKLTCRLSHRALCVSPSLLKFAQQEGFPKKSKMQALLYGSVNGIDTEHFNPALFNHEDRKKIRAEYGIPAQAQVMGYVGRLVIDKGIIEMADAWDKLREQFPDLHLLMVGPTETTEDQAIHIRKRLEKDPRVHWTGFFLDIPRILTAMDLLVLPSYREGFGYAPLEAAAMELPSVATRIIGLYDAVVDGETGILIKQKNTEALVAAVKHLLDNPQLRDKMGQAGRRRVLDKFRQEMIWEALTYIYRQLLVEQGVMSPLPNAEGKLEIVGPLVQH